MPVPSTSSNFGDLLDPRFQRIFNDRYRQLPDRIGDFFDVMNGDAFPTRDTARFSQTGTLGDIQPFTGVIAYDDVSQGYTSTMTHVEYASGFQVERKLFDDDLYGIMDNKPKALATAYVRTRQKHGAQFFNNAFSVDSTWNTFSEAVAVCSSSHTTTSGAATTTGFANSGSAALSAVAVAATRIAMRGFRGDRGERISVVPDMILIAPDNYQVAYEIVESSGVPDTANNNANVHKGAYRIVDWEYLTSAHPWFMIDSTMMKDMLKWVDRIKAEFGMVEDFDTLVGKWRVYCRYSLGHNDWRFLYGQNAA